MSQRYCCVPETKWGYNAMRIEWDANANKPIVEEERKGEAAAKE